MPLDIRNATLDAELDRLAARQPMRLSRHALAEALLVAAVRACKDDPLAWMALGQNAEDRHGASGAKE